MAKPETTVREGRRDKGGLNDGPGDYRPEPPSALKPQTTVASTALVLAEQNRLLLEVRSAYWQAGYHDAAVAIDDARNSIAAALHALQRCAHV